MRFLFIDHITCLIPGKFTQGIKQVSSQDYYLTPSKAESPPHFVTAFIGEAIGQLAAWNVMQTLDFQYRPVAGVVAQVCPLRPVYVHENLQLEATIEHLDEHAVHYHGQALVDGQCVFTVEGALGPLLPMIDFIDTAEVKAQFEQLMQPSLVKISSSTPGATMSEQLFQFDSITQIESGKRVLAQKKIVDTLPFFPDHFPCMPVLPMTALLECKMNLAKWFLSQVAWGRQYQITALRKIKMNEFVRPGDVIDCEMQVLAHQDKPLILRFRSEVAKKRVCVADLVLTIDSQGLV